MNEIPALDAGPRSKEPGKRRGLALPPRGQALARLQDLEGNESAPIVEDQPAAQQSQEGSNAVNTARSNAVIQEGSTAAHTEGSPEAQHTGSPPPAAGLPPETINTAPAQRASSRAAREPTTRITVDMPDSLHRQISYLSVETRRSIKDLVIAALEATYFGAGEEGR